MSTLKEAQAIVDTLGDQKELVNDGSHSFSELYYHRMVLFSVVCDTYKEQAWKSWKHADGSMYDDYFIVGISTPEGDYSYHYHKDFWDKFDVPEIDAAPEWDGHKPEDVTRLLSLGTRKLDDWIKREFELASVDSDEYTKAIYNSAAKAYVSLAGDGHSGMSIGFTKQILNRLIDHKPLTPLTGVDDEWGETMDRQDDYICYQNKRCSSVFKYVYDDGRIEYSDIDQFVCEDIHNSNNRWHAGYLFRRIRPMFPIAMPYSPPTKPMVVYVEEFLYDENNGDFDTVGAFYMKDNKDEKIDLNIFLAEAKEGFVEITEEEYNHRRDKQIVRQ